MDGINLMNLMKELCMKNLYDEAYYENGKETGKSCYTNYRWLPELTLEMAKNICLHVNIKKGDKILDFGCAKGFCVHALSLLGYNAKGCDLSEYAINNCHPDVKDRVSVFTGDLLENYDVIIAKDVLEHVPYEKLYELLSHFRMNTKKLFVIVPLGDGKKYYVPDYELDVTHIIREDKSWWENAFTENGFSITESKFIMKGIKDNWAHYEKGNGFFILE